MKIAVVQHRLREDAQTDAQALALAALRASQAGAEFVVMPDVPSLSSDKTAQDALYGALALIPGERLIPIAPADHAGVAYFGDPLEGVEDLGRFALFIGDAAFRGVEWLNALASVPSLAIICPRSESELQAEAALEVALSLSDSLAGLVIVAECTGAETGSPGHGGSAIIHLGKVLAEAMGDDDLIVADVNVPVAQPEPREPLPQVPTILAQRVAVHAGQRPAVDYPAEVSDSSVDA
jgi:predicted amidohydrolase